MSRLTASPATLHLEGLPAIYPNAAALDISADEIVVAVPTDRDSAPVRAFRTFTADLHALVSWLLACRIDTVAMESTGVYWIPQPRHSRPSASACDANELSVYEVTGSLRTITLVSASLADA